MARMAKIGVDYFPHYVGSRDQKTLFVLKNKFGNNGYAFWYQLLEILGSEKDLSYNCDKPANWLFLTASTGVSEEVAEEILSILADLEAIDMELWVKYRVIWCQDFADQLEPIYKKRRQEVPCRPHIKGDCTHGCEGDWDNENSGDETTSQSDNQPNKQDIQGDQEIEIIDTPVPSSPEEHKQVAKGANRRKEPSQNLTAHQPFVEEAYIPVLDDWLNYKKAKGQPYKTEQSILECYQRIVSLSGGDPNQAKTIVGYNMANNYSGLFSPKRETETQKKRVPDCLVGATSTHNAVNISTI